MASCPMQACCSVTECHVKYCPEVAICLIVLAIQPWHVLCLKGAYNRPTSHVDTVQHAPHDTAIPDRGGGPHAPAPAGAAAHAETAENLCPILDQPGA